MIVRYLMNVCNLPPMSLLVTGKALVTYSSLSLSISICLVMIVAVIVIVIVIVFVLVVIVVQY